MESGRKADWVGINGDITGSILKFNYSDRFCTIKRTRSFSRSMSRVTNHVRLTSSPSSAHPLTTCVVHSATSLTTILENTANLHQDSCPTLCCACCGLAREFNQAESRRFARGEGSSSQNHQTTAKRAIQCYPETRRGYRGNN